MGGGPSPEQKAAASSTANLTAKLGDVADKSEAFKEAQQQAVNPYYMSRMTNGLPFYGALTDFASGNTAQAFAPARAAILRRTAGMSGLPSGYREGLLRNLDAARARAFDQNIIQNQMSNEQAKAAGAAGLLGQAQIANPTAYYNAALSGNQSIMQAPLQSAGVGGLIGGLAQGALSAIPF